MAEIPQLEKMIVFAILMESGDGITIKAPRYVREKYYLAINSPHPETLLDRWNREKFNEYRKRWID